MTTPNQSDIAVAIELFERFRNEFAISLSEHFVAKHERLKLGSGGSSLAMVIALGVANAHAAIVKTATGLTLDDGDLCDHHRATGAVIYALMSSPGSQEDAESAVGDFSAAYAMLSKQQHSAQMSGLIEVGLNLGGLERACRENPENRSFSKRLVESFAKVRDDIYYFSNMQP